MPFPHGSLRSEAMPPPASAPPTDEIKGAEAGDFEARDAPTGRDGQIVRDPLGGEFGAKTIHQFRRSSNDANIATIAFVAATGICDIDQRYSDESSWPLSPGLNPSPEQKSRPRRCRDRRSAA